MKYDVSMILSAPSCRIVVAEDAETSRAVEQAILDQRPEYRTGIHQVFGPKKFGPFTLKNKKALYDILAGTRAAKEMGPHVLRQHIEDMGLLAYEYRIPTVLSPSQKERSSILYEALTGRTRFLLNEVRTNADRPKHIPQPGRYHYPTILSWLRKNYSPCDLIWITDRAWYDLFNDLGESLFPIEFFSFFMVKAGQVIPCDTKTLMDRHYRPKSSPKMILVKKEVEEETPSPSDFSAMQVLRTYDMEDIVMVIAQMVQGEIFTENYFENFRSGDLYFINDFRPLDDLSDLSRNADDPNACTDHIDAATEPRPFLFYLEGRCDIEPEDLIIAY